MVNYNQTARPKAEARSSPTDLEIWGQYIVRLALDGALVRFVCVLCRPILSARAYGYGTEGFHKVSIVENFFSFHEFLDQQKALLLEIFWSVLENHV